MLLPWLLAALLVAVLVAVVSTGDNVEQPPPPIPLASSSDLASIPTIGWLDEDDVGTMLLLAAAANVDLDAVTEKLLPVAVLLLEMLPTRFSPAMLLDSDCCRTFES